MQKAKIRVLAGLLSALVGICTYLLNTEVRAIELQERSIRVGSSVASTKTTHQFRFNIATEGAMGSIVFEYCANSADHSEVCEAPVGLSALSVVLDDENGELGFSVHPNSTSNKIVIGRPIIPADDQAVSYGFSNIENPSTARQTVYVRISTHATDDGTGPWTDNGGVAFSTTNAVGLGTSVYVPPYLIFCTGVSVAPDCSGVSGSMLDLGELSTLEPRFVTSQFAGATNDYAGYTTSLLGTTMTSGNNVINALATPAPSIPGTPQYGINLRANSNPSVGQNPLGAGTSVPEPDYNSPDMYAFKSGTLTSSSMSTNFNTFTVSYIVNVPLGQAPGIYSTTVTYIAVAQF